MLKPGGNDTFVAVESVRGSYFDDTIKGNDQDNRLNGVAGNDVIYGGGGNDKLACSFGISELYGEEGDDLFIVSGGIARIDGGSGANGANFAQYFGKLEINLGQNFISYNGVAAPFLNISAIKGSSTSDVIYDSAYDNEISSASGDDTIYLSDGNDIVDVGEGKDTIFINGSGKKEIIGGGGADIFYIGSKCLSEITEIRIYDFEMSDKFDLRELKLDNFSLINIIQNIENGNKRTIINIAEKELISLYNLNTDLESYNFIFDDIAA